MGARGSQGGGAGGGERNENGRREGDERRGGKGIKVTTTFFRKDSGSGESGEADAGGDGDSVRHLV